MKTSEIQPSIKEVKKISKEIRNTNRECRVPTLPGEPAELHVMNNCHIIGEAFLKRIAQESHIYKLLHDPTVVGNSALKEIKAGNVTRLPWDMTKVVPSRNGARALTNAPGDSLAATTTTWFSRTSIDQTRTSIPEPRSSCLRLGPLPLLLRGGKLLALYR